MNTSLTLDLDETIAALASPPGGARRGIIRISGSDVSTVLGGWFTPNEADKWQTAKSASVHRGHIALDSSNDSITCPIQVMYWPGRRSYTGQPLAELHLPGAPALLETVLSEAYQRGARAARPGEFTMRAFLAGKLDLLQAEAVLGVIDAESEKELQTALAQLAGGVSGRLAELRRDLLELLADLEAGLDFVDEDIEFVSRIDVVERLETAYEFVLRLVQQTSDRMQSRTRRRVVLAGLPNAGKSTLFNHLVGSDAALVSPEQGTTRDFLTTIVRWPDLSFDLIDTAGWEHGTRGIAAAAQQQRNDQLQQADLIVWCTSSTLTPDEQDVDEALFREIARTHTEVLQVFTKADLTDHNRNLSIPTTHLAISVINGIGISTLRERLREQLVSESSASGQWLGMTAARCRDTLGAVLESLAAALQSARLPHVGDELIAVDLRQALDDLGTILGVIYTDDILDRVFSKFCIGK